MTLIHRGTKSSDLRPTLLITASDSEKEEWWSNTLPKLEEMCSRVSGGRVDVELLHGAIFYASDRRDTDLNATDFGQQLQMGGSIGAAGSKGSGTIGAAIKLRIGQDPEPTTFVLTNHHVTAKDKSAGGKSEILQLIYVIVD
jgi:hypothetical protein